MQYVNDDDDAGGDDDGISGGGGGGVVDLTQDDDDYGLGAIGECTPASSARANNAAAVRSKRKQPPGAVPATPISAQDSVGGGKSKRSRTDATPGTGTHGGVSEAVPNVGLLMGPPPLTPAASGVLGAALAASQSQSQGGASQRSKRALPMSLQGKKAGGRKGAAGLNLTGKRK
jgi:hypothetical protein